MRALAVIVVFLLGAIAAPVQSATVDVSGATFPTRIEVGDTTLALAGTGTATYRVVFTVYGAAFYVPAGTPPGAVLLADTPRHLEIEYFYEIAPEDIIKASMTVLERQHSDAELAELQDRLDRWHATYRKVVEGDRYAMTYRPGDGTTLKHNGETLITMPGEDFARAYFGIWLGSKKPLDTGLRADLKARLD